MTTAANRRYPAIQGEGEEEYETELEAEQEDEAFLGGLANLAGSLLGEGEEEYEDELEAEEEDEAFLGGLANLAGSLLGEGEEEYEGEYEGEFEFEFEAEAEAESEGELEDEDEDESEAFVNPVRRIYRDAELMAHLSTQATRVESESEAEAFIGALIPIAARLIPRAARLVSRNAPALIKGATRITRRLRRDPRTRRLVQAMPVILQRTAQSLADQAANGVEIDPTVAVQTLGQMSGRVLSGPGSGRAVRAVRVFDQRYHRRHRRRGYRPVYYGSGRVPSGAYRRQARRGGGRRVRRR
jgi:hypothetical protein